LGFAIAVSPVKENGTRLDGVPCGTTASSRRVLPVILAAPDPAVHPAQVINPEMIVELTGRPLSAVEYLEHNKALMRYDEYLAAGYPIGSSVAEGRAATW
jgi:hypothetical protein